MVRRSWRVALAVGLIAGGVAAGATAQTRPVYRYQDADGRVFYSDQPPPANAANVEAKRLTPNLIETDQTSLAARRAQDRFPVTLYSFACGDVCDRAEALLNRRGVPYATVNVREAQGAEKLRKLTGELQVPVLQVGDKLVGKGFSESEWQKLLDDAGYPKTPPLRRGATRTSPPTGAQQAPAATPVPTPVPEPASGGYPRN